MTGINNNVTAEREPALRGASSPAIWVLALFLAGSLGLNAFLGWKFTGLRKAVDRERRGAELQVGSLVPPIKARDQDGRLITVDYTQSSLPTLLYFFSPGCDTCASNLENFKKLSETRKADYRIFCLSLTDDGIAAYAGEHHLSAAIVAGLGVETTIAYKLGRVPQTAVISPEGRVLGSWYGTYNGKQRQAIEGYFHVTF